MASGTVDHPHFWALDKTYTSQSYVDETNFNRLAAYTDGNIVIFYLNLQIASSPGTTQRKIGKFTLPRDLRTAVVLTVAGQSSSNSIMIQVDEDGDITIYSNSSATGWYRAMAVMPLKFDNQ